MNANEISPKANFRMNRIQKVSRCIRLFLLFGIPLFALAWFPLFFGMANQWHHDHARWVEVLRYVVLLIAYYWFGSPAFWEVFDAHRLPFLLYGLVWLVVFLFWFRTILKLLGFFEKGILFTAETVRYLQILGGIYIFKFMLQLTLYVLMFPDSRQVLTVGTGGLFAGLLIIFIGWLIDEARKIREEQELTV
jgi:hypothetical protein